MKHAIGLLVLAFVLSAGLHAQTLNGRFVTSAYGWERQLKSGESTSHMRAYENIQLNFGTADISFHTYMQGSTDLGDEFEGDPHFRLFNAYLRVKNLADMLDVKLGRQPLFAGVSYGTIDGASVRARPTDGVEVMAYAGGLTRPSQDIEYYFLDHVKDNWQIGGQVLLYLIQDTKIGLSYMNRHRETTPFYALQPDAQMGPVQTLIDYGSRANQYGSIMSRTAAAGCGSTDVLITTSISSAPHAPKWRGRTRCCTISVFLSTWRIGNPSSRTIRTSHFSKRKRIRKPSSAWITPCIPACPFSDDSLRFCMMRKVPTAFRSER